MGKTREPMIGDPAAFIARFCEIQQEQRARFLLSRQRQLDRMRRDWREFCGDLSSLDLSADDDSSRHVA